MGGRVALRAFEFGCTADGRALQQASIDAGSTVLHAADGTLRPGDVGKNVAIPGAVDLVASITELLNRKDVAKASMTAGEATLSAVLTEEDGFFQERVHKGRRITVAGAGPDGKTLVTDVVKVDDRTTLTLAHQAETSVTGVMAILNRPDRVNLSDHARATSLDNTIHLGDREVSDAGIVIGQRGLNSATAKFSSEDLGKTVTLRAAGLLVTTIAAFTSDVQVGLAVAAQRGVVDGPGDVWRTDSRPGFEALRRQLECMEVEAAEIEFGPGVYDFTRPLPPPGTLPGGISLEGRSNLTLRGAGAGATVLRLMPNQDLSGPDSHVIFLRDCRNVTVRDLSVHGSHLTMGAVNEQMHGIFISQGCNEVTVEKVRVFQSTGDGIRLAGEADNNVSKVWLERCRLIENTRTGIAFQRAVEQVWVHGCYIEMTPPSTDACIDFEPTGAVASAPSDVVIDSNQLVHDTEARAVSISGIDADRPARRVRFTNNTLHGGGIGGVHAEDVTISHNTFVSGERGQVMLFRGGFDGLRVEQNTIMSPPDQLEGVRIARLDGRSPSRVRVVGNDVDVAGGISFTDPGSHIEVRDNRIHGRGHAAGISMRLEGDTDTVHRDIRIVGNTVTSFADAGILLSTGNTAERFDGVEISENDISADDAPTPNDLVGIRLSQPGTGQDEWLQRALVTGNRIAASIATKIERDAQTVPHLAIGGNAGHRASFEGDIDPEGRVPAPFGSVFVRVDTSTIYLKMTAAGSAGWEQILPTS
jgi:hypothetical protein